MADGQRENMKTKVDLFCFKWLLFRNIIEKPPHSLGLLLISA